MLKKILTLSAIILISGVVVTFAQSTEFRRVKLAYGISLDIPSYWTVLSQDTLKNLRAAGEAMTENAGIEGSSVRKETLLSVNATPEPTGAMIRVSISSPPDYTQADLASITSADLKEVGDELLRMFKKLEASGGPKLFEMQEVRIEKINNHRALVMPYIRASKKEPSPWQVAQYKIPVSSQMIEITLSYRQSDALVWKPILEKVKRSFQFENSVFIQADVKNTLVQKPSALEYLYGPLWWLTIIVSFVLTWGIGLVPPFLIRYVIVRRPLSKGWAIGLVVFLWMVNIVIFTVLRSQSKTHAALFLVAWTSYIILKKKVNTGNKS